MFEYGDILKSGYVEIIYSKCFKTMSRQKKHAIGTIVCMEINTYVRNKMIVDTKKHGWCYESNVLMFIRHIYHFHPLYLLKQYYSILPNSINNVLYGIRTIIIMWMK